MFANFGYDVVFLRGWALLKLRPFRDQVFVISGLLTLRFACEGLQTREPFRSLYMFGSGPDFLFAWLV